MKKDLISSIKNGSKISMKTALITGVTGQDGSYLAELLLNKGYAVVGIKRRSSSISTGRVDHLFDIPNFHLEYGDLLDFSNLLNLVNKWQPDEIYNLGAQSHVRVSFDMPKFTTDTIVTGTLNLLEIIRQSPRNIKLYQASSSEMFGDVKTRPQSETTVFQPASPYACAKLYAHNLCGLYRDSYNMFVSCGILFNHESPRRGETFVTRKIARAAARISLGFQDKVYLGNLDAYRDWGHAQDYVEAMHLMLQHDRPDDFVVATGESYTVKEFLKVAFEHLNMEWEDYVEIDERLKRPKEVPYLLGDYSKIKEALGWEPKIGFAELVIEMVESELKAYETL